MKTLLTANLSTKTAHDGGSEWTPPVFTFGEALTIALRFQRSDNGDLITPLLDVQGLTAAFGYLDARPLSATWALQIGAGAQTAGNTTAALPHDCTPAALAAAINAKSAVVAAYGTAAVKKVDGSWFVIFGTGAAPVPMTVRDNQLAPACYGRTLAVVVDEIWIHEVRLVQVPLAFTDASEAILPDAPSITRIRAGGSGGGYSWNEIQALYVPPDFLGTYALKRGFARTALLSVSDNADAIQAALLAELGSGTAEVLNVAPFTANIEFTGSLGGTALDLLEVLPLNPPAGDLTFTLTFDRAELLVWLRAVGSVTLPLEVRIRTADADDVVTEQVAFRTLVTVQRPVIFPDLALVPSIDWLRPISPKSYVPFSTDTVITGQQFNRSVVGDGVATSFAIADGLATDDKWVVVRENTSPGAQLIDGTDFSVEITDADNVLVTALGGAPGVDGWAVTIISAQSVAAFANGLTVTIGQVTGLDDRLTAIEDSLAALLALVPTVPLGSVSGSGAAGLTITIPAQTLIFPGAGTITPGSGTNAATVAAPVPLGGLLPAIHDAVATSFAGGDLPDVEASAGAVFTNDSGAALYLDGGLRTHGSCVAVGGFFGSDGRRFYPLSRQGATTSYYPRDFERELFAFEVNAQMLRAASTLSLEFLAKLQLLGATTRAQYLLVIEHGIAPSQSSPATTATNLEAITWNATPLASQRVILTQVQVGHLAGVEILRDSAGDLSANKLLYGYLTAADAIPASAAVAIRARLINFDTENSVVGAKGAVFIDLPQATATISY